MNALAIYNSLDLKKPLTIQFRNEHGRDGNPSESAGIRREFFLLVLENLLSTQYGMFRYYEESRSMWFNEDCFDPEFRFVGIICGMALYNDNIVDLNFPLALYKKLLGEKPDLSDLEELDPSTGRSLKRLYEATVDDCVEEWYLSFTIDVESVFGEKRTVELIPNGKDKVVTYENRMEYIERYIDYVFNAKIF